MKGPRRGRPFYSPDTVSKLVEALLRHDRRDWSSEIVCQTRGRTAAPLVTGVILGFRREVYENCALFSCYAASSGNFLPMFWDNLSVWHSWCISCWDVSFLSIWRVVFIDCSGVYRLINLCRMLSINSCGISSVSIAVAYHAYQLFCLYGFVCLCSLLINKWP